MNKPLIDYELSDTASNVVFKLIISKKIAMYFKAFMSHFFLWSTLLLLVPITIYITVAPSIVSLIIMKPLSKCAMSLFGPTFSIPNSAYAVYGDNPFMKFYLNTSLILSIVLSGILCLRYCSSFSRENISCWSRLIIRICMASLMIYYGLFKIMSWKSFSPINIDSLQQQYPLDPQIYMWQSLYPMPKYRITLGCIELLVGILLLIPRFISLGGMLGLMWNLQILFSLFFYYKTLRVTTAIVCIYMLFFLFPLVKGILLFFFMKKDLIFQEIENTLRKLPSFYRNRASVNIQWIVVVCIFITGNIFRLLYYFQYI